MKRLLFLICLLGAFVARAQTTRQTRVGWNVNPIFFRTLELSGEYRPKPHLGFLVNVGYTDRNRNEGFPKQPIKDFIDDRVTSGGFVKVGGRVYWNRFRRPEKIGSFFTGLVLVGSYFEQRYTQLYYDIMPTVGPRLPLAYPVFQSGFVGGGGLTLGYNLTGNRSRWGADFGIQYTFHQRREYPGRIDRNYQPGFGRVRGDRVPNSLQGIFTLSYRL